MLPDLSGLMRSSRRGRRLDHRRGPRWRRSRRGGRGCLQGRSRGGRRPRRRHHDRCRCASGAGRPTARGRRQARAAVGAGRRRRASGHHGGRPRHNCWLIGWLIGVLGIGLRQRRLATVRQRRQGLAPAGSHPPPRDRLRRLFCLDSPLRRRHSVAAGRCRCLPSLGARTPGADRCWWRPPRRRRRWRSERWRRVAREHHL
mmetsp:Transcript_121957/g.272641  ORF Transcript_121957/g.272641 Transcript_121957/m.272641 type:complete len:201 (-) Transcript_121957:209-811(-)